MLIVVALAGLGGVILGINTNIRMFVVLSFLMVLGACGAGGVQGGLVTALVWALTALVASQAGYMVMIVARAVWRNADAERRQPASF